MSNDSGGDNGGCLGKIIIVAIIAGLIYFLVTHFSGLGFGFGKGNDKNVDKGGVPEVSESISESAESIESTSSLTTTQEEVAEPAMAEGISSIATVTIKENKYIFDGKEYQLEELITELKKKTDINVQILDDDGYVDALDSLKKSLDENGIKYTDETAK